MTSDILACKVAFMTASYGIGDHCLFVIDFSAADMIGISHQKVACPTSRRLNTKIPRAAAAYARILEGKVLSHQLIGYLVGPKYEFVLIDKGIVERVAITFSGHRQ